MTGTEQPDTHRGIADVLRDFAGLLADEHSVDDILHALGDYCTELLPVDSIGVLLRASPDGQLIVGTSNTETGRIVEQLEVDLREGPCTLSMQTGHQIIEPDLQLAAERYPNFVPRALAVGIRSIHGLPLTARLEQIGALDLITADVLELTPTHLSVAQTLADVAVAYVSNRQLMDASTRLTQQLQQALDSRIIIEQAKGVIAERYGVSMERAFEALRQHARSQRMKIHDLAADVLANRQVVEP